MLSLHNQGSMDEVITLSKLDIGAIVRLDDPYFKFDQIKDRLEALVASAKDVAETPSFWEELPDSIRELIRTRVTELQVVLNEIIANRENPTWLTAQYESRISSINARYEELYRDFVRAVREHRNSLDTTRSETRSELERLKKATRKAEKSSISISEVTSETSALTLYEYFETSVNGSEYLRETAKTGWRRGYGIKGRISRRWSFFVQGKRGYEASARKWLLLVVLSIAATSFFGKYLFRDVNFTKVTVEEVLARALLLAAPAYAIRFCVRNYNAAKHLAAVNRHKSIVLRTLLAFLDRQEITDPVREQIISEAARQVFSSDESGYLTRRDGAGSSESVLEFPVKPGTTF